jgi:DNA-binding transcriptional LysR family regulator
MNMKEIEVLSELVNYQSFSDAAFSLAYSPSVISKYVSNIEKELGIRIIVRGNKSN